MAGQELLTQYRYDCQHRLTELNRALHKKFCVELVLTCCSWLACDGRRSRRKNCHPCVPEIPQTLVLRLLRSRSQASSYRSSQSICEQVFRTMPRDGRLNERLMLEDVLCSGAAWLDKGPRRSVQHHDTSTPNDGKFVHR